MMISGEYIDICIYELLWSSIVNADSGCLRPTLILELKGLDVYA